jgi:adenylate kinase family enzyme
MPFDSNWRKRLADYTKTEEFVANLKLLEAELRKRLPGQKSEKKYMVSLCGLPGSGKTTIAKELVKIIPAIHVSSTWIFFEKLREYIDEDYYKAYCYEEALGELFASEGYSVVFDDNNRTVKNRAAVFDLGDKYGAISVLVNISVDLETALEREILKGGEPKIRSERLQAMNAFISQMEDPTPEERARVKVLDIDGTAPFADVRKQLESFFEPSA